jgi:Reverse transcriptase (RNA-dependent DNA polymerase)
MTQGKSQVDDPGEGKARQSRGPLGGHMGGAQKPSTMSPELQQIAEKARGDRKLQFTSVAHLLTVEALESAWKALKKRSSAGIDGVTATEYEQDLRGHLERLHERLRAGQYVAPPVRRSDVPKEGAALRPIGIPTIEDKMVQAAVARIRSAIYEQDFRSCSYGFRPGRRAHDALTALDQAIFRGRVNDVLEADIHAFFDELAKGVRRMFLEHRVKDRSLLRLMAKWRHAGVLEDGVVYHPETGTPQGGVVTPPTQSQTLLGTGSCPIRGSGIENIDGDDIGNSTLMTHERSAARPSGPVRRTREPSARPVAAVSARGRSAHAGPPVSRISSPGPAVCGSGAAASPRITRAGADGSVHREAASQSGAPAPGSGSHHRGESQLARHARARRLAASGETRTRRWTIGTSSTPTCLTAWAVSG